MTIRRFIVDIDSNFEVLGEDGGEPAYQASVVEVDPFVDNYDMNNVGPVLDGAPCGSIGLAFENTLLDYLFEQI